MTENDLTNWSIELLNGVSSVYTESVIIGEVVQPIGGITRIIEDLNFCLNQDSLDSFNDNVKQYSGLNSVHPLQSLMRLSPEETAELKAIGELDTIVLFLLKFTKPRPT